MKNQDLPRRWVRVGIRDTLKKSMTAIRTLGAAREEKEEKKSNQLEEGGGLLKSEKAVGRSSFLC